MAGVDVASLIGTRVVTIVALIALIGGVGPISI